MIPYGRQDIDESDVKAVTDVLLSDFLTQGPVVPQFENAVAKACGTAHAIAVNSATSALHIACLALGLGPGMRLWTSPITFAASANCGRYCGADVDFVDIDRTTLNIDPIALRTKLEEASRTGNLPHVLVVVHFTGASAQMDDIATICRPHGIKIIEDASHAIGGSFRQHPIGSCKFSDICVFSFHPVKIVTTAEGGMCLTNNAQLARMMQLYRSHGITREPNELSKNDGPWYYEQQLLGFNYRMPDLNAALGLSQLTRLQGFVARRHQLFHRYLDLLEGLPVQLPVESAVSASAHHLFVIRIFPDQDSPKRQNVFVKLRELGIGANVHYIPVHTLPYYRNLGFNTGQFPVSEWYYRGAITLPLFAAMTDAEQEQVKQSLQEALS
jgi:UDP-4-amino-4,6-dideoxy-N-acetyl-beta-L-altrosamine transaminase